MGCTSSKSSNMIVLDPRQLKRSPSGHHLQFELPTSPSAVHGGPIIEELSSEEASHDFNKRQKRLPLTEPPTTDTSHVEDDESRLMRVKSWRSEDFADCVSATSESQLKNGEVVTPKVLPAIPTLDPATQKLLNAAMESQKKILYYLSPEGMGEFKPNGKVGPVVLMVVPQTSDAPQGAADWKLIGTACCKALTDEEVAREMEKVKAWMDGYKALFAKEPTQWYLNGMIFDRTIALDLIDQQNKVWLKKKGLKASKATSKNYKVVTK
ncbi:hypothetical protein Pmar_PMAR028225 [Perkinsus marinus ATCC 50983]|uniref:Uncharacterized protein n=1 Tax=Perkinsus marinus (strain ATCC 50983 / TXsc) TaxID=423536 RepID=C5LBA9_PERM5|nr:hypothetical protein Pmar_PMAR028225 [Perkinsus marinus ATCC 50983]EER06037.1 hypothetical protein Pmar_PMAR028225 [Perkinsus marinus ATCC 50983]|eukprot:XP_002774221.1 hypothetical protein Pmar_PMAR028225 [Perkinsus marinus ATCC 50983]